MALENIMARTMSKQKSDGKQEAAAVATKVKKKGQTTGAVGTKKIASPRNKPLKIKISTKMPQRQAEGKEVATPLSPTAKKKTNSKAGKMKVPSSPRKQPLKIKISKGQLKRPKALKRTLPRITKDENKNTNNTQDQASRRKITPNEDDNMDTGVIGECEGEFNDFVDVYNFETDYDESPEMIDGSVENIFDDLDGEESSSRLPSKKQAQKSMPHGRTQTKTLEQDHFEEGYDMETDFECGDDETNHPIQELYGMETEYGESSEEENEVVSAAEDVIFVDKKSERSRNRSTSKTVDQHLQAQAAVIQTPDVTCVELITSTDSREQPSSQQKSTNAVYDLKLHEGKHAKTNMLRQQKNNLVSKVDKYRGRLPLNKKSTSRVNLKRTPIIPEIVNDVKFKCEMCNEMYSEEEPYKFHLSKHFDSYEMFKEFVDKFVSGGASDKHSAVGETIKPSGASKVSLVDCVELDISHSGEDSCHKRTSTNVINKSIQSAQGDLNQKSRKKVKKYVKKPENKVLTDTKSSKQSNETYSYNFGNITLKKSLKVSLRRSVEVDDIGKNGNVTSYRISEVAPYVPEQQSRDEGIETDLSDDTLTTEKDNSTSPASNENTSNSKHISNISQKSGKSKEKGNITQNNVLQANKKNVVRNETHILSDTSLDLEAKIDEPIAVEENFVHVKQNTGAKLRSAECKNSGRDRNKRGQYVNNATHSSKSHGLLERPKRVESTKFIVEKEQCKVKIKYNKRELNQDNRQLDKDTGEISVDKNDSSAKTSQTDNSAQCHTNNETFVKSTGIEKETSRSKDRKCKTKSYSSDATQDQVHLVYEQSDEIVNCLPVPSVESVSPERLARLKQQLCQERQRRFKYKKKESSKSALNRKLEDVFKDGSALHSENVSNNDPGEVTSAISHDDSNNVCFSDTTKPSKSNELKETTKQTESSELISHLIDLSVGHVDMQKDGNKKYVATKVTTDSSQTLDIHDSEAEETMDSRSIRNSLLSQMFKVESKNCDKQNNTTDQFNSTVPNKHSVPSIDSSEQSGNSNVVNPATQMDINLDENLVLHGFKVQGCDKPALEERPCRSGRSNLGDISNRTTETPLLNNWVIKRDVNLSMASSDSLDNKQSKQDDNVIGHDSKTRHNSRRSENSCIDEPDGGTNYAEDLYALSQFDSVLTGPANYPVAELFKERLMYETEDDVDNSQTLDDCNKSGKTDQSGVMICCKLCGKWFRSHSLLEKHTQKEHHQTMKESVDEGNNTDHHHPEHGNHETEQQTRKESVDEGNSTDHHHVEHGNHETERSTVGETPLDAKNVDYDSQSDMCEADPDLTLVGGRKNVHMEDLAGENQSQTVDKTETNVPSSSSGAGFNKIKKLLTSPPKHNSGIGKNSSKGIIDQIESDTIVSPSDKNNCDELEFSKETSVNNHQTTKVHIEQRRKKVKNSDISNEDQFNLTQVMTCPLCHTVVSRMDFLQHKLACSGEAGYEKDVDSVSQESMSESDELSDISQRSRSNLKVVLRKVEMCNTIVNGTSLKFCGSLSNPTWKVKPPERHGKKSKSKSEPKIQSVVEKRIPDLPENDNLIDDEITSENGKVNDFVCENTTREMAGINSIENCNQKDASVNKQISLEEGETGNMNELNEDLDESQISKYSGDLQESGNKQTSVEDREARNNSDSHVDKTETQKSVDNTLEKHYEGHIVKDPGKTKCNASDGVSKDETKISKPTRKIKKKEDKKDRQKHEPKADITDFEKVLLDAGKSKMKEMERTKKRHKSEKKDHETSRKRHKSTNKTESLTRTEVVNNRQVPETHPQKHFMLSKTAQNIVKKKEREESNKLKDGLPDFSKSVVNLDSLPQLIVGSSVGEINNNNRLSDNLEEKSSSNNRLKSGEQGKDLHKELKKSIESLGIVSRVSASQKTSESLDKKLENVTGKQSRKRAYDSIDSNSLASYKIPKFDFNKSPKFSFGSPLAGFGDNSSWTNSFSGSEKQNFSFNSYGSSYIDTTVSAGTFVSNNTHEFDSNSNSNQGTQMNTYGGSGFSHDNVGFSSMLDTNDKWQSFTQTQTADEPSQTFSGWSGQSQARESLVSSTPSNDHKKTDPENNVTELDISQLSSIHEKKETPVKKRRLKRYPTEDMDSRIVIRASVNSPRKVEMVETQKRPEVSKVTESRTKDVDVTSNVNLETEKNTDGIDGSFILDHFEDLEGFGNPVAELETNFKDIIEEIERSSSQDDSIDQVIDSRNYDADVQRNGEGDRMSFVSQGSARFSVDTDRESGDSEPEPQDDGSDQDSLWRDTFTDGKNYVTVDRTGFRTGNSVDNQSNYDQVDMDLDLNSQSESGTGHGSDIGKGHSSQNGDCEQEKKHHQKNNQKKEESKLLQDTVGGSKRNSVSVISEVSGDKSISNIDAIEDHSVGNDAPSMDDTNDKASSVDDNGNEKVKVSSAGSDGNVSDDNEDDRASSVGSGGDVSDGDVSQAVDSDADGSDHSDDNAAPVCDEDDQSAELDDVLDICDPDMDMFMDEFGEEEKESEVPSTENPNEDKNTKDEGRQSPGPGHYSRQSSSNTGSHDEVSKIEPKSTQLLQHNRKLRWMPFGYCYNYFNNRTCVKALCKYQHNEPPPNLIARNFKENFDRNENEVCLDILRSHSGVKEISKQQLDSLYRRVSNKVESFWLLQVMKEREMPLQMVLDNFIRQFAQPKHSDYLYRVFEIAKELNIQLQKDVVYSLLEVFSTQDIFLDKLITIMIYSTEDENFLVPQKFFTVAFNRAMRNPKLANQLLTWLMGNAQQLRQLSDDKELISKLCDMLEMNNVEKDITTKLMALLKALSTNSGPEASQTSRTEQGLDESLTWSVEDETYWNDNVKGVKYSKDFVNLAKLYIEKRSKELQFTRDECQQYINVIAHDKSNINTDLDQFLDGLESLPPNMKEKKEEIKQHVLVIIHGVFEISYEDGNVEMCVAILDTMRSHGLLPTPLRMFLLKSVRACLQANQSMMALEFLKGLKLEGMDSVAKLELIKDLQCLLRLLFQQNLLKESLFVVQLAFKLVYNGQPEKRERLERERQINLPFFSGLLINAFLQRQAFEQAVTLYQLEKEYGKSFPPNPEMHCNVMTCLYDTDYRSVAKSAYEKLCQVEEIPRQTYMIPRKISIPCMTNSLTAEVVFIVEDYLMTLYNILCQAIMSSQMPDTQQLHLKVFVPQSKIGMLREVKTILEKKFNPPLLTESAYNGYLLFDQKSLENYLKELDKKGRCQGLKFTVRTDQRPIHRGRVYQQNKQQR